MSTVKVQTFRYHTDIYRSGSRERTGAHLNACLTDDLLVTNCPVP